MNQSVQTLSLGQTPVAEKCSSVRIGHGPFPLMLQAFVRLLVTIVSDTRGNL